MDVGTADLAAATFAAARRAMVDGQIRTSDVTHSGIIAAMLDIPREPFVPPSQQAFAYLDRDVPIAGTAGSRYLTKPMVLARLIQAAEPNTATRALVIGAGTGYSAAVLARLCGAVTALEEDPSLFEQARSAVSALGSLNVNVIHGQLSDGAPAAAPYDVILVDGGVETLPDRLCTQLSASGRLLTVEVRGPVGRGKLFQAVKGKWSGRELFDAWSPVLPGFRAAPAFVF